jgi:large conductance mechanosensitive channel
VDQTTSLLSFAPFSQTGIFLVIKQINRFKKAPPPAEPTTKDCPKCCTSIPIKASRCPNCTSELAAT